MRYFLTCSYLGTPFHGWQRQPNAHSVQAELETALQHLLKVPIGIMGSSRTDTGVHARHQVAHFDWESVPLDTEQLVYRLNRLTSQSVAIQEVQQMPPDAHARFDAIGRKYIYRIEREKNPFNQQNALFYSHDIDVELMNEAAATLYHHIDYQCFSKVHTDVHTFDCQISEAKWLQNGSQLEFHISANRFLRGMVRAIVGTLVEVGKGKLTPKALEQIILSKNRKEAKQNMPAVGLTLEQVLYPENYFNRYTT